jgi:glycosyltransferase involved in cell wall biosynthesis
MNRTLSGRRIGFYTSVVGMGGSEVIFADAMEAGFQQGAEIVCWSADGAAIRKIVERRGARLDVKHHSWPETSTPQRSASASPAPATTSRTSIASALKRSLWRGVVPFTVRRHCGFHRTGKNFVRQLRSHPVDLLVVNVNGSEGVSLAGPPAAVPVLNCYHLSYTPPRDGFLSRWGDQLARRQTMFAGDLAVHVSHTVRNQWCDVFRYPRERTRVIYNGVDPDAASPEPVAKRDLQLRDDQFVFCFAGRLDEVKGLPILVEAVRRYRGELGDAAVLICGDGPLSESLRNQTASGDGPSPFRFLGWRSDLPSILRLADCSILASISSENLSIAILESLMAGTPAIVTQVGGMAEAVRDGVTGYVVPPADPDSLGSAMVRMLRDRAKTAQMGAEAKADARSRFTRDRMIFEYADLFAELIERSSRDQ